MVVFAAESWGDFLAPHRIRATSPRVWTDSSNGISGYFARSLRSAQFHRRYASSTTVSYASIQFFLP
jgi:hypothetical protein